MFDMSLQTLISRMIALVILAPIYGFTCALVARMEGDDGPTNDGRAAFDPFRHLDILGSICGIVFGYAWIRPIDVQISRLRGGVLGALGIIVAGTAVLCAMAALAGQMIPLAVPHLNFGMATLLREFLNTFMLMATGFAIINLLPIPPFGAGILLGWAWPGADAQLRRISIVVGIIVIVLLATGYPQMFLAPIAVELATSLGYRL